MKNRSYVGKQLRADDLTQILKRLGARRVYIAEDEAGNTISSISKATVTRSHRAAGLYPYKRGLLPDESERLEYNITELE